MWTDALNAALSALLALKRSLHIRYICKITSAQGANGVKRCICYGACEVTEGLLISLSCQEILKSSKRKTPENHLYIESQGPSGYQAAEFKNAPGNA
eukprot:1139081-Pelagomonas_calceolata.AAC.3